MQTVRLHFAFYWLCVCVSHCCRQWLLKKIDRWRVGVEHEKSSDESSYISFVHLHTHTHSGSCLWSWNFCVFVCAWDTWLRSIMKVLRPTDTDSLLCMHVKIPSTRPISASFAGTSEPIRAMNTIRPTCQNQNRRQVKLSVKFQKLRCLFVIMEI